MRLSAALRLSAAPRLAAASSSSPPAPPRVTVAALLRKHALREPIVALTAYDAPTASLADAHADLLLVGDSVGMVVHGRASTVRVSLDDMALHCAAVSRGARRALLVGDLPFGSYTTPASAARAALRLAQQGGMHAVKLEGGRAQAAKLVAVRGEGVPAMAHVGLLPQTATLGAGGAYAVQGRSAAAALAFVEDALAVQRAGAFAVVFELVPAQLAAFASALLEVPSVGIGAGPFCGGQVLVSHDMLGLQVLHAPGAQPRFVRRYADVGALVGGAFERYAGDVRAGRFPGVLEGAEGAEAADAATSAASAASTALAEDAARAAANSASLGARNGAATSSGPAAANAVADANAAAITAAAVAATSAADVPPARQAFFDMAPRDLEAFRALAQSAFRGEAHALSVLDAAAEELEQRRRSGPRGLQAASTAGLFRRAAELLAAAPTASTASHISPAASAASPPPSSPPSPPTPSPPAPPAAVAAAAGPPALPLDLAVAILGSGPIASLAAVALGGRVKRLAMFSSWSARLNDIGAIGGVRWRRNVDGAGDGALNLGAEGMELHDLAKPGVLRRSLASMQQELEREDFDGGMGLKPHREPGYDPSADPIAAGIAAAVTVHELSDLLSCFDVVLLCGKAHQVEAQAALAALLVRKRFLGDKDFGGVVLPLYNGADTLECLRACFVQLRKPIKRGLPLGMPATMGLSIQLLQLSPMQVVYGQTSVGARYVAADADAGACADADNGDGDGTDADTGGGGGTLRLILEHTGDGSTSFCAPAASAPMLASVLGGGFGEGEGSGLLRARGCAPAAREALRWRKLAVNSLLNPVCALLGAPNGGFAAAARGAPFRRQVAALADEAARALACRLPGEAATWGARELLERAEAVAAATAANTNSMLADLRAGRASEAPFISGAVSRALGGAGAAPAHEAVLAALAAREAALGVAPRHARARARVLRRAASAEGALAAEEAGGEEGM